MTLDPNRARQTEEEIPYVSCRLDNVVVIVDSAITVWRESTLCCGRKGIGPGWMGITSFCKGPEECILLKNKELFYPPDEAVWKPYLDLPGWSLIAAKFLRLSELKGEVHSLISSHIKEQQRRWGIE